MSKTTRKSLQIGAAIACVMAVTVLGACATTPPPIQEISRAESALQGAEQSGAREYAPLELKFAQEKLAAAKEAVRNENYERAEKLAEQALVNAQLAEAKADAAEAREVAQQVRESVETLRAELLGREAR